MTRKPAFWIVFVVVSLACAAFALRGFPRAFPLLTLDLYMDREAALEEAERLAGSHGWGPGEGLRQATVFRLDRRVQSFVELEAGGTDAFAEMLAGDLCSPYTWRVRHFKEGEVNETTVRFTPAGVPYGFRETMPEDEPGASLAGDAARDLAEQAATRDWGVDLSAFELVEASQELRPGGRTDHTLVYERSDVQIGDGLYRLRLVVSGDRFTGLAHFVKVPEAFERRFEEMRSANDSIAFGSLVVIVVLYLAGGCVIGLLLLLKKRWVLWKQPLAWGLFVAFLQVLVSLNQWPLMWMTYDTAVSATNFVLQQLALVLVQFLGMGIVLTVSFMAAESLTRRAFGNHVQLWRTWSHGVSSSRPVLGATVAGYLLVAVFFAYEVVLYFVANRHLGWWTPSELLADPDQLAAYFPWLTSVAVSLQAGFWEECLFRAVPLACAALIGQRLGGRRWWIIAVLILQAVVFGAGHANYPAQPSYARMVELVIPALGFGLLYLAFGLLPAIVLHYAYDVVWFALPLFASSSSGGWVDKVMVVVLTLVPLWLVLRGRWRAGSWGEAPESDLNRAWKAPPPPAAEAATGPPVPASTGLAVAVRRVVLVAGGVAVVAWLLASPFHSAAPPLRIGRAVALTEARQTLTERGVDLPAGWRELSTVSGEVGASDRFVWREGDPDAYRQLLGSFLQPPHWLVRYARFEGDVAERAEEYRVRVSPSGSVFRFTHDLPESRPGMSLDEDQARRLARSELVSAYGLEPDRLTEVSAEPSQHPERRDWRFVFSNPEGYPLSQGEARIAVRVAGDRVVDSSRFVHVPEEWERNERNRTSAIQIIQILCTLVLVLLFLSGAVVAIVRWARRRFAAGTARLLLAVLATAGMVVLVNSWPAIVARFSTAQPFGLQAAVSAVGSLLAVLVVPSVVALLVGLAHRWIPAQAELPRATSLLTGAALGTTLAAIGAVASAVAPALDPPWASTDAAGTSLPLLAAALAPIREWISGTALVLLVMAVVNAVTAGWTRHRVIASILLLGVGVALAGSEGVASAGLWLVGGLITGCVLWAVYVFVLRFELALIPVVTAAMTILATVREGAMQAYPGALAGSIIGAAAVAVLASVWQNRLIRDTRMEQEA